MDSCDLTKWIWFSCATLPAYKTAGLLLLSFDTAEEVYDYDFEKNDDFDAVLPKPVKAALCDKSLAQARSIYEYCDENDIFIIPFCDERYPSKLRMIPDPPVLLYCKGRIPDFSKGVYIASVGTRSCSEYGTKCARYICEGLARAGITVVSGMAYGIDKASHIAALNAGALTVAVLGCGVDVIYPKENEALYHNIKNNGSIISEYPPLFQPTRTTFPERNRIISGICDGVLVVEAPEQSGSLITANRALNQGRTLYAVPGNIDSPLSVGTNMLIQQGAKPVTNPLDIVADYQMLHPSTVNPLEAVKASKKLKFNKKKKDISKKETESDNVPRIMNDNEKAVYNALCSIPKSPEEISEQTGLTITEAVAYLSTLTMREEAKELPGDLFIRTNLKG